MSLEKEAVAYLKKYPVFLLLMKELAIKYYRFGDFRGTISKKKFAQVDMTELYSFLGLSQWQGEQLEKIKVADFVKHYEASRFYTADLENVVAGVLGNPLITKEEQEHLKATALSEFTMLVTGNYPTVSALLGEKLFKKWFEEFIKDDVYCQHCFEICEQACQQLPQTYTKLPVFAYNITGNPHEFDKETTIGALLFQLLQHKYFIEGYKLIEEISRVEQENEIYGHFYLVKDDIMNFVAVNGLLGKKQAESVGFWTAACEEQVSWNVPLRHLLEITEIRPAIGDVLFLIENSGVYSILLNEFPDAPIICTNGQFRYAVWVLLEKIAKGITIYYSGDFDPEGLLMAQILRKRYGDQISLMVMAVADYEASQPFFSLNQERLKKLSTIEELQLLPVAQKIQVTKLAGYQEGVIERIKAFIAAKL